MQDSSVVQPCEVQLDCAHILYDAATVAKPQTLIFEPRELAQRGVLVGEASGRARVYFIRTDAGDWVLRHYRRGGVVANLLGDNYLWTGKAYTRAWREWRLLHRLWTQGLPVPRPVAARVTRRGFFYKADLITQRLMQTRSLAHKLRECTLVASGWTAIGVCIRRFHDAGLCHADLNAHNILLTEDYRTFLIDFDKSTLRTDAGSWRRANLARLRRSLIKLQSLSDAFHFSEQGWEALCNGYDAALRAPHSAQ
ncbi:MAG: 3-deoxy-D-manno-octulosonic acid kinase [Acidiferrobacterales bacterium]